MRVEAAHAARHGGADEVLGNVEFDHSVHGRLEHARHGLLADGRVYDHGAPAALDPVHCTRLLVRAEVARNGDNLHVGKDCRQELR